MSLKEKDLEAETREHVTSPSVPKNRFSTLIPTMTRCLFLSQTPLSSDPSHNAAETRRIIRKLDLRLLPTLAVIYAFALIDRVNLPNVSPATHLFLLLHT
jgi:hypothetical protein